MAGGFGDSGGGAEDEQLSVTLGRRGYNKISALAARRLVHAPQSFRCDLDAEIHLIVLIVWNRGSGSLPPAGRATADAQSWGPQAVITGPNL